MNSALGWLGDLVAVLASVVPRLAHVRATHRGVKFVRGRTREIGPGLHWWWPVTTEIEVLPVVRQYAALSEQALQTKDGETVSVDGFLSFEIHDLHRFVTEAYDAAEDLDELGQAAVRKAIIALRLPEIQSGRVKLDHRLTKEATELLEPLGITVLDLQLKSCAPGTVLIHAGNSIGATEFNAA